MEYTVIWLTISFAQTRTVLGFGGFLGMAFRRVRRLVFGYQNYSGSAQRERERERESNLKGHYECYRQFLMGTISFLIEKGTTIQYSKSI